MLLSVAGFIIAGAGVVLIAPLAMVLEPSVSRKMDEMRYNEKN